MSNRPLKIPERRENREQLEVTIKIKIVGSPLCANTLISHGLPRQVDRVGYCGVNAPTARSLQFGRASAPKWPQRSHRILGPKEGTGTSSA